METRAHSDDRLVRDIVKDFFADLRDVLEPVTDRLHRIWKFWGPRLTDRGFVAGILMNASMLGLVSFSETELQWWSLAIWIVANFVFPTWDALPAGEKIEPRHRAGAADPFRDKDEFDRLYREAGAGH